jgi:hypothetical protein
MKQLILGPNITTDEGFQLALSYAKQNTLNITFDKLISSVIAQADKKKPIWIQLLHLIIFQCL